MLRFAQKPLRYGFQYHADQDPTEIVGYWAVVLDIDGVDDLGERHLLPRAASGMGRLPEGRMARLSLRGA
jgi:hypothetical protein